MLYVLSILNLKGEIRLTSWFLWSEMVNVNPVTLTKAKMKINFFRHNDTIDGFFLSVSNLDTITFLNWGS